MLLMFMYGNLIKADMFISNEPISLIFPLLIDPNKNILLPKLLKICYWLLVIL